MVDEKVRLIMGSLLHDTGKVIYRQGDDRRNHSISGYDYLKEETNLTDSEILDCVRYHHASLLKRAVGLKENSLAYIVYLADNIAAFSDRRKKDESEDRGFERSLPLQSVFNILNGNHQEKYYHPGNMDPKNGINDPGDEKIPFSESFYTTVKVQITENLKGMDWNSEYLNSLLTVLEANLSYVPSSTSKEELADELNGRIEYLRIRFVYECGRDDSKRKVRNFVEKSEVLEILKEIKKSKKNYLLFSRYMEALVAFHKYYGGKEQ